MACGLLIAPRAAAIVFLMEWGLDTMNHSIRARICILSWAISFALYSTPLFAETKSAELLVRFKTAEALLKQDYSSLINSREKIAKLSFPSEDEARAARTRLLLSGDVAAAVPNFTYRPAIHLEILEIQDAPEVPSAFALPFFTQDATAIASDVPVELPDVRLPTGIKPGVDPLAARDWSLRAIRMPAAAAIRSLELKSDPVLTAVIDTGMDYNHEDLIDVMWHDPNDASVVGYDFAHENAKPYDVKHFDMNGCLKDPNCLSGATQNIYLTNPGHGTHCAGHVGATANNSVGIRGVGGNVRIMALKTFWDYTDGAKAAGMADDGATIRAIDYAIEHGVKVISASWGARMNPSDAESSELKNALLRAQDAGILFVTAAGNDKIDNDQDATPDYPASFHLDNMIVVAASDPSDALAPFSNYGVSKVDLAAPGVKILSTTVGSTYSDTIVSFTTPQRKPRVLNWDGTSMATPLVAGAAALVWSQHPDENYLQIKQRILSSVRHVPPLAGKVATGGVLNVSAALGL